MDTRPPPPAHYNDLEAAERAAWDMLVRGAKDRRHAFHQATVATVRDGFPEARTVVLRDAERAEKRLRFHTDTRSGKFADLTAEPRCALLFYDHGAKVQVRARGIATLHTQDEVAEGFWRQMRDFSKACYRQPLGPGEILSQADGAVDGALEEAVGWRNFVVVRVQVQELDWLYLAAAGHRRALFRAGQAGVWLAP